MKDMYKIQSNKLHIYFTLIYVIHFLMKKNVWWHLVNEAKTNNLESLYMRFVKTYLNIKSE